MDDPFPTLTGRRRTSPDIAAEAIAANTLREDILAILELADAAMSLHQLYSASAHAHDLPAVAGEVNDLIHAGRISCHLDRHNRARYQIAEDTAERQPAPPEAPPAPRLDAIALLHQAAAQIVNRADQRNCPNGERSMARTVALFNALTGFSLSELDGWQFMQCLKLARSRAGRYVADDYIDNAAYAALAAETAQAGEESR